MTLPPPPPLLLHQSSAEMRKQPSHHSSAQLYGQQPQQQQQRPHAVDDNNVRRSNKSESGYASTKSQEFHSQHAINQHNLLPTAHEVRASTSTNASWSAEVDDGMTTVRCILVGDGAVGKTSLVVSYTTNGYPHEYVPTAFDTYTVKVHVNDEPIKLQLSDTAGQTDFDTVRPLCYADADVFLLCFSVVSPSSFYNLATQWMPEIRRHAPNTPVILCGTQIDLRANVQLRIELRDYGETPVSEQDGREYADEINAVDYVECSALTQHRLKEVFDTAIMTGLRDAQNRHKVKEAVQRPTSSLQRLLKSRLVRTSSTARKDRVVSEGGGKTHSTETQHGGGSEVMLKRKNSITRTNDVRPLTTSGSTATINKLSVLSTARTGGKPSKLNKTWHRLLCMARRKQS